MRVRSAIAGALALLAAVPAAGAQEVTPEVTLGGRGIVSLNGVGTRAPGARSFDYEAVNDFSDSALLLRLWQRMFGGTRGGAVVGFQFPDADSDLGQVFFHQVHLGLDGRVASLRIGRSRVRTSLLDFPTLRDDDLVEFAYVPNAFSSSGNSEFTQYGNVLALDLYGWSGRLVVSGWAENRVETDGAGRVLDEFGVNAVGASVAYRLPEPVRFAGRVRRLAAAYDAQKIDAPDRAWLRTVSGAAVINLLPDPIHLVDLRVQGLYTDGSATEGGLASIRSRARARSWAAVGSLRYLWSPYMLPRVQGALTGGVRRFPDADAALWTGVASLFYRLGANFDLGVQYQETRYSDALAAAVGRAGERGLKVTLIYNFDVVWNDYFDPRDSILSLEHGYIP